MADQKITELPIKTSTGINLTDYLLGIDSAEGYQMLVSDIAKKIVEDYAGSSLAGSAQSITSAFTQVPLLAGVNTILTSGTDLNTVTTVGTYNASNAVARSLMNGPEGVTLSAFRMTVERALGTGSELYRQTIILGASVYSGYRRYTAGRVTWSAWEKIPERPEIDAVANKVSAIVGMSDPGSMTSYSTQQFTVASSSRHLIIISGAKSAVHGLLLVSANSNGEVFLTPIHAGDGLVITTPSNNILQVQNTSNVACYFTDICTNGTAITKVTESTNSAQSESI